MKMGYGYDEQSRHADRTFYSEMGLSEAGKANAARDHALKQADLVQTGEAAAKRGDTFTAKDCALRHEYNDASRNAGLANDNRNRESGMGNDDIAAERLGQRDEFADRMDKLETEHDALQKEGSGRGREITGIKEERAETIPNQQGRENWLRDNGVKQEEFIKIASQPERFGQVREAMEKQQGKSQEQAQKPQQGPQAAPQGQDRPAAGQTQDAGENRVPGHQRRNEKAATFQASRGADAQGYEPRSAGFNRDLARSKELGTAAQAAKAQASEQEQRPRGPRM